MASKSFVASSDMRYSSCSLFFRRECLNSIGVGEQKWRHTQVDVKLTARVNVHVNVRIIAAHKQVIGAQPLPSGRQHKQDHRS